MKLFKILKQLNMQNIYPVFNNFDTFIEFNYSYYYALFVSILNRYLSIFKSSEKYSEREVENFYKRNLVVPAAQCSLPKCNSFLHTVVLQQNFTKILDEANKHSCRLPN